MIYDVNGNVIGGEAYNLDFSLNYGRKKHEGGTIATNYTVIRIFQTKADGSKQYPFLYAPNGAGASTSSTLQMNMAKNFPLAVNAGIFETNTSSHYPLGTIIQNGVLIQQGTEYRPTLHDRLVLTIDNTGTLGYAEPEDDGATMISNGIVSAVLSFIPLIINYRDAGDYITSDYLSNTSDAQRQVIGQFGNGDYCILTCEGRGYQDSTGFTVPQLQELCIELGLKFAFNLDGGGSAQTVVRQKQINTIYEGTYGRIVPNYLVFNGSSTFVA